ncbi:putative receptor-type adenylate cyclase, partial [Trypanosoma theileri]
LVSRFLYGNVFLSVGDLQYGAFYSDEGCINNDKSTNCALNYGATRISVWSMSRALDPTVPELFPPVTPSMKYVEPSNDGLTLLQLIGIIIGAIVLLLLLVGVLVLLLCR